jgi:hypothetical protein
MRRDDDTPIPEYDADVSALFEALPRETSATDPRAADRLVTRLRHEGFFSPVTPSAAARPDASAASGGRDLYFRGLWPIGVAAAAILMALSAWGGWLAGRQGSLEEMLARKDLTLSDRVLLLQRAGSAYVTAAESYASATARTDTTAIEVASRVLLGAAHAVARNHLDAGVAARLTNVLQPSATPKPTIWF